MAGPEHQATADQKSQDAAQANAPHRTSTGLQALEALLKAGSPPVDAVVGLVRRHRPDKDAMLTRLHQTLGNGYVQQVVDAISRTAQDVEDTQRWETTSNVERLDNAPLPEHDRARLRADIVDEHLAHSLAYKDASELTDADRKYLHDHDLQVGRVMHGMAGLDMTTFVPLPGKTATPVLAFRGTKDTKDFIADVNPAGVGAYQMSANEGLIAETLASLSTYGAPTVTGHSLGGALAQMTAARFAGQVGRVVTFQSPGIPADMAAKLDEHNREAEAKGEKPVESTHYAVSGDVIPLGGEAFTRGFTYIIDRGLDPAAGPPIGFGGLFADHQSSPLAEYVESGEGRGKWPAGMSRFDGRGPASAREAAGGQRWNGAGQHLHTFAEAFRYGLGRVVEGAERLGHLGSSPTQAYIATWDLVRQAIDSGGGSEQIVSLIEGSKVRETDKLMMIDNLRKIEASRPKARHDD